MITRSTPQVQAIATDIHTAPHRDWKSQLAGAVRDPLELCRLLGLSDEWQAGALAGDALFKVRVPHAYLSRIERGNPDDPLLRQVLPIQRETDSVAGFVSDPLEEADHQPLPGLIHKYGNRVLLITSGACAINCRYCFRRHYPYADNTPSQHALDDILHYLNERPHINEVILSGGDPLASSDKRLEQMAERLTALDSITRLRIHTRLPVVIPDRIDEHLLGWLAPLNVHKVMVLHINHAQEIDDHVIAACQRLREAGVMLLNQSVLLRGVNDSVAALARLSERLMDAQVLPYYLHVLDPVAGAAHFDISDREAVALVEQLRKQLSGFLMPRLVREIPGEVSKTPLY
ncbi:EF-P beta-lysylation protein EpmB [Carnimonas nigrificans]|uniref:EF-P beta-lysylation protein EpmB n=1 Tax=Carnimonas nigrificans TaxID=64323 RepID=UPI00047282B3|nr:EF-P beta-lysylation protein EpmB [Carnimonas nigrificans]